MTITKSSRVVKSVAALALAAGAVALAPSARADVSYSNFDSTAGLQLNGATQIYSGAAGSSPKSMQICAYDRSSAGTFYATDRQRVDLGFTCNFRFRMRDRQGAGSDGLTFIIQNQGLTAVGGTGGGIGYATNLAFPTGNTGIRNSVAVVFDTWDNSANWPSTAGNNVLTVQHNPTIPNPANPTILAPNDPSSTYSLGALALPGAFNDQGIHSVQINYSPVGTGLLDIYYDVVPNATQSNFTLRIPNFNITNLLATSDGSAWVGFTAATGALVNIQRHEILDWTFRSNQIPAPTAAGVLGLGGLAAARRRRR
jgi:hypothetical protein